MPLEEFNLQGRHSGGAMKLRGNRRRVCAHVCVCSHLHVCP